MVPGCTHLGLIGVAGPIGAPGARSGERPGAQPAIRSAGCAGPPLSAIGLQAKPGSSSRRLVDPLATFSSWGSRPRTQDRRVTAGSARRWRCGVRTVTSRSSGRSTGTPAGSCTAAARWAGSTWRRSAVLPRISGSGPASSIGSESRCRPGLLIALMAGSRAAGPVRGRRPPPDRSRGQESTPARETRRRPARPVTGSWVGLDPSRARRARGEASCGHSREGLG